MKKEDNVKKSKKNPTTNYSKDSHKAFCKRCLEKHHDQCPNPTGEEKCNL